MLMMLNSLLREAEIEPKDVRLLRHKDQRADKGRTPYELWRDDRPNFEAYQSTQGLENETRLNAPYWASFVGTRSGETIFVGLYSVKLLGPLAEDRPMPHREGIDKAGSCNAYNLTVDERFRLFDGRLFIEWGPGLRSWIQRADQQNKQVTELRKEFKEPDFPGFLNLICQLSQIDSLPNNWIDTLKAAKGIYLLTCPKTEEQYVGKADGEDGFWGRWQEYVRTGHGGNVALKSREPSDYQASILEVVGTRSTEADILKMEKQWKDKLQSREMGLNRN